MLLPNKKEQKPEYFLYITCSFSDLYFQSYIYKDILKLILYHYITENTQML